MRPAANAGMAITKPASASRCVRMQGLLLARYFHPSPGWRQAIAAGGATGRFVPGADNRKGKLLEIHGGIVVVGLLVSLLAGGSARCLLTSTSSCRCSTTAVASPSFATSTRPVDIVRCYDLAITMAEAAGKDRRDKFREWSCLVAGSRASRLSSSTVT